MSSLDREGKKVAILSKLARGRYIGMNYIPVQKAVGKIPGHARGNLRNILDEMRKDGLLEYHKKGACISLNPGSLDIVVNLIEDDVPDYILERLR